MMTDETVLPRFEIRPLSAEEGGGYLIEFPDYPGCIGKARYENPIRGNQYQELVNALYACEVYRTG